MANTKAKTTAAKKAPAKKTVARAKAKEPAKRFEGPIGPIEDLPGPNDPPKNKGELRTQHAGAASISARPSSVEREYYPDNPALRNQKVYPVSDSAGAHGYYFVADAPLYNLFDEMVDREPVIASALELKVAYLLMRPRQLMLTEADAEDPKAGAILDFIRKALVDHEEFNTILWSLAMGTCQHGRSTVEVTYDVSPDNYFIPYRFFHCHPGQFRYKRDGTFGLIKGSYAEEGVQEVPARKFIWSRNPALYDNPHGRSDLYSLRFYYYFKKKGLANFVRIVEKNGVPFLHIEIPEGANYDAVKADLIEALETLMDDDALLTGFGVKVNSVERSSNVGEKLYSALLDKIDQTFVRSILGAELQSTVTDRGARSLGEVHERTVLNKVLPLARYVEKAINALIRWLVEWNFGAGVPVPYFEIDTEEKTDSEQARETLKAAQELGLEIATAQAREWLGIRPPEPEEDTLKPKASAPATEPGEDPDPDDDPEPDNDDQEDDPEEDEDDEEEARNREAAEALEFGDAARDAFNAYLADPERKAFASLWQADNALGRQFRETSASRARARQAKLSDRLEVIGQAAASDSAKGLIAMKDDLKKSVRSKFKKEDGLDLYRVRADVDPGVLKPFTDDAARRVVMSSAFLSLGMIAEGLADVRADHEERRNSQFAEDDSWLDALPDDFRDAVEWMSSREVMTVAAVRSLAKTIADELGVDWQDVERGLRSEVLALAGTTNTAGTKRVQSFIADSVGQGKTVGAFLEDLDAEFGLGDVLPEGENAYWNNVFRTETSNAYSAQQEAHERSPEVDNNLWGHETYNPKDKRSRKTHARLQGLRFKKGSTAWSTLGRSPFAFQCRCVMFALMAPGGTSSRYEESSDALAAAANLERF